MSETVGDLADRCFRTYLEPPHLQPAHCLLAIAIDADDTSITLGSFSIPEDEELVREGVILELDRELVRVTAYDEGTSVATVQREVMGTTAAAHVISTLIKLAPPYPRQSVFEAVADNIITLYPDLYSVDAALISTQGGLVAAMEDPLAVEIIEVWSSQMSVVDMNARLVDFHPAVGQRAVITDYPMGSYWIRYRKRFGSATTEGDLLATLGVDQRWEQIVVVGACADLLAGADIGPSHTSFIQAAIEAEQIPPGTRVNLAQSLANYRQRLLNEAKQEMRAEYRTRVQSMATTIVDTGWA